MSAAANKTSCSTPSISIFKKSKMVSPLATVPKQKTPLGRYKAQIRPARLTMRYSDRKEIVKPEPQYALQRVTAVAKHNRELAESCDVLAELLKAKPELDKHFCKAFGIPQQP